jgi:hypothetical protein
VAERVVDLLEAVEVDEGHREARARRPRPRDRPPEVFGEARAVGQARQRVVVREVAVALLRAAPLAHVAGHGADHPPAVS